VDAVALSVLVEDDLNSIEVFGKKRKSYGRSSYELAVYFMVKNLTISAARKFRFIVLRNLKGFAIITIQIIVAASTGLDSATKKGAPRSALFIFETSLLEQLGFYLHYRLRC
jgi:hypothetical protein